MDEIDVTLNEDTEKFSHLYGENINEPSASDWAVSELMNAIVTLEKEGATGYVIDLKQARARLQAIIDKTLKPF